MTPKTVMDAVEAFGNVFAPVSPKSAALINALSAFGRIAEMVNPSDPVSVVEAAAIAAEKATADAKYGKAG